MKKTIWLVTKILLVTLVVMWISLVVVEFVRFKNDDPMLFAIHEEQLAYDDGHVYIYYGLGYKEIIYERTSLYGKQFGHLFTKPKEELPEKNK